MEKITVFQSAFLVLLGTPGKLQTTLSKRKTSWSIDDGKSRRNQLQHPDIGFPPHHSVAACDWLDNPAPHSIRRLVCATVTHAIVSISHWEAKCSGSLLKTQQKALDFLVLLYLFQSVRATERVGDIHVK